MYCGHVNRLLHFGAITSSGTGSQGVFFNELLIMCLGAQSPSNLHDLGAFGPCSYQLHGGLHLAI